MTVTQMEDLRQLLFVFAAVVAEEEDLRRARGLIRSLDWLIGDIEASVSLEEA